MASSSSPSPSATLWDVFLSFRGIDTRSGFTSHLHSSLHRTGIRTFIDEPELRAGDVISFELRQAIKQSKIYIVVLSKNYASSGWCLDELVEIMRSWKSLGRLVLPIFYNIEPSVVRHQIGSFKEAFEKHEGRVAIEIVNNWRGTLKEVADLSGYHLRHLKTEADIINDVVDRVILKINPATLHVAKHPVAIDSRVADIKSLLGNSSSTINGVHWIGIHGMGGVGKTTLAKAFYNKMFRRFDGSCFLADIKDVCVAPTGAVSLQQQLIDCVLKRKNTTTINNVHEGINFIRERICSLKVLVVLDDLDNPEQVNYLVGKFLVGSVIILTTRNADLLDAKRVKARYKVDALGAAESRQLFIHHAFGDTEIKEELMVMSEEIIGHAGGLPLALTVFGSNLFEQPEIGWRWFIDKLRRVSIDTDVEEKLMISFDALKLVDPMLQDIFLDIACFFLGMTEAVSVTILETCYTFPNYYIGLLEKRCLMAINDYDELSMHDLLREMGRKIARNGSRKNEPEKHSRLFTWEDIHDVLENDKGTEAIEGMIYFDEWEEDIDRSEDFEDDSSYSIDAETFNRMPNLRFICLRFVNLRGSFGKPFKDLRWFRWRRCSGLPPNFCAEKLVILDLRYSSICRFAEKAMVLRNLKILDMSGSFKLSRTPDFNGLKCLETLNLSWCCKLVEVDISLGNLLRLAILDLSCCGRLRSLPESICKLRALKTLYLSCCSSLKALPMELGDIESLTELNADGLSISQLPDSLGRLSKLVMLDLSKNKDLQSIPNSICNLRSLERLYLTGCSSLKALPMDLGNIESLTDLKADGANISQLPDSLGRLNKLVMLDLRKNRDLQSIPDTICNLRSLNSLYLKGCPNLKALPMQLGNIESLTHLVADGLSISRLPGSLGRMMVLEPYELNLEAYDFLQCIDLRSVEILSCFHSTQLENLQLPSTLKELKAYNCLSLPSLSNLQQLEKISIYACIDFTEMEGLQKLISVKELHLDDCKSIQGLPKLSDLQNSNSLRLKGCSSLTEIQGLEEMISITELDLRGCISLKRLPNLSKLRQLHNLQLMDCSSLTELHGLEEVVSITQLDLRGCISLKRLPNLYKLQQLHTLQLTDCSSLTEIQGLEEVVSITRLNLRGCISLKRLPNLSKLRQLHTLQLTDCSSLTELHGLEEVISITELDLRGCISLKRLPNLSKLRQLHNLQLMNCSSLTELHGLEEVVSITQLDLRGCISLKRLPNLYKLQQLHTLQLTDCSNLTELHGLEEVVSITRLDLRGCISLKRLPNLYKLRQLPTLQLTDCSSLTEIQGLGEVYSITQLDLVGCISLKKLPNLSNLQQLECLRLTDCSNLTEIEGVEKLISIRGLYFGGCNSIKRLPKLSHLQELFTLQLNSCSSLTEIQAMKRVAYLFKPSISTISVAAASSSEIPDRALSAVFLSGMNGDAKEANHKSKVWKVMEVTGPSLCQSIKHPDNMRVTKISRLIYTNSGNAILALASNGIHLLWKWVRDDGKLYGKATASISPQLWQPSSGVLMTNEVTAANPEDALSCFALSKNDYYLISASGGKISVFNMMTFKTMTTFLSPPPAATVLAFYPQDNNIIAIGLEDSSIQIYNVRADEIKSTLNGHSKRITGLSFSQILNVLVSSGADAQLCVWSSDAWEKQNARYLQLPDGTIPNVDSDTHIQFHLDQIYFLVVHETQLAIYETEKLERLKQRVPWESVAPIPHATFSCDSQLIYACFMDASVCVFTATDLSIRSCISPMAYLPPRVSTSSVNPLVIAAHPKEPNQIAVGLSDGGVCVIEPPESEDVPPPLENDSASSVRQQLQMEASDSDQVLAEV